MLSARPLSANPNQAQCRAASLEKGRRAPGNFTVQGAALPSVETIRMAEERRLSCLFFSQVATLSVSGPIQFPEATIWPEPRSNCSCRDRLLNPRHDFLQNLVEFGSGLESQHPFCLFG
jgi:hypothetical protein